MSDHFRTFDRIVRSAGSISFGVSERKGEMHPFDERNIHSDIGAVALRLFDDGHYSQATFEAFKMIDNIVKKESGLEESGYKLMMAAFAENNPKIRLTSLSTASERDEQKGYKFIFAGSMSAIRNPRGHEIVNDPIEMCLDHLSFASVLLRRLESSLG